jgi:CIC family chloride channel protein
VEPHPERKGGGWKLHLATPSEPTLVLLVSGLVGVYAGLATGLFANAIAFFHLLFFRTKAFWHAVAPGPAGQAFRARFLEELAHARWHLEYLVVGGLVIVALLVLDRLRDRTPIEVRGPGGERKFLRLAQLLAAGLALFYPLTLFAALNRAFPQTRQGLAALIEAAPWWLVVAVPAVGGLVVGLLVKHFSPESRGHGVAEVIEAVHAHGGKIPARVAGWKGLTAAISIGSGGSVGREGPVVQVGATVGSTIGQHLAVTRGSLTTLVAAGAAAGIASSFNAPIAGATFALEIILLDFGVRSFAPIVLASVTSVITAQSLIGQVQEIARPGYEMVSALEIGPYALLGVIAGLVSLLYVKALAWTEDTFAGAAGGRLGRLLARLPAHWKPALGGALLGVLGLLVPRALGTGYETMNAALLGQLGLGVLVAVLAGKLVGTSLTLGSGGSGGSFFPAMVLGATLGGAFGTVVHVLFPHATASAGAYALVGMGAVVAGATLAPLTGIVMLFELTGNYEIVLPLMVTCGIAAAMMHRLHGGESIYTHKLAKRGIARRPAREQVLLRSLRVGEAMTRDPLTVPESLPFQAILEIVGATTHPSFPMVDDAGRLTGMLRVQDVRGFLFEEGLSQLVVAKDLARPIGTRLFEDDDLEAALQRLVVTDFSVLPVVSRDDPARLVGVLSQRDVLAAFGRVSGGAPLKAG